MNNPELYIQYGFHMLPVVVAALRERRTGIKTLFDFLPHAWNQMSRERALGQSRRSSLGTLGICRRDRLSVGQYFELARRSNQALEEALAALEKFIDRRDERHLDLALRQYEKAERLQQARVKTRMSLSPRQNDAIATAC